MCAPKGWDYFLVGMGKVESCLGSYRILSSLKPRVAVLAGIAGGYRDAGVAVGDVLLAEEEVMVDEGRRGRDWLEPIFGRFPRFSLWAPDVGLRKGVFNTVSSVSGDPHVARLYWKATRALCENMEGASVARVCQMLDVKLVELRVVSNMCGERGIEWGVLGRLEEALSLLLSFLKSSVET